jgi:hypothetical protein
MLSSRSSNVLSGFSSGAFRGSDDIELIVCSVRRLSRTAAIAVLESKLSSRIYHVK